MRYLAYLTIILLLSATACTPGYIKEYEKALVENPETQIAKDRNEILRYAIDNKIELQRTESGLFYRFTEAGEGTETPSETSKVTAHYAGRLLSTGKQFDSSYDRGEPLEFPINRVIKGWQEMIQLMPRGSKATVYIPSGMAYGSRGAGADIPPNAVLVFDIELLDFE